MCFYFKKSVFLQPQNGRGVAQLVARYVRDVEAGSSSLLTPTLMADFFRKSAFFVTYCLVNCLYFVSFFI